MPIYVAYYHTVPQRRMVHRVLMKKTRLFGQEPQLATLRSGLRKYMIHVANMQQRLETIFHQL